MGYINRGIYVYRMVCGRLLALKLSNQTSYKEWVGCYSKIQWF